MEGIQKPTLKTKIQRRIEFSTTDGRSYQRVPYTKLLGGERALKQWLHFSKLRCINNYNHSSDKTPLRKYLSHFIRRRINKASENLVIVMRVRMHPLEEMSKLERGIESSGV
jgi:hypothetical protein